MEIPTIRVRILTFIGLENDLPLTPKYEVDYYTELKILKGEITKVFVKNEYVTFYEFKLFHSGIETKQIRKRFSEF
jgi:hypothetical protein